jgi:hypothetical protein
MNRTKIEYYDKGWIEALIDGEGSLSLIKEKRAHFKAGCTYKPRLNISNNSLELLKKARAVIGAGCIMRKKKLKQLDVSSNGLRFLLPKIQLIVKEKQRRLLLDALHILALHKGRSREIFDEEINQLEQIYVKIRELNGGVWNKQN